MSDKKFKVVPHPEMGEPEVLEQKFGKYLIARFFKNPHRNDLVEEFVQFGQKDWAVVLPITEDNNVVIVRQFKQGCAKIIKELPAGTGSFLEKKPQQIMVRELREETGYQAKKIVPLQSQWLATRNSPTKVYPFLALGCTKKQEPQIKSYEPMESFEIPFSKWLEMVLGGKIDEWSAIVTTTLSMNHLKIEVKLPDWLS